MVALIRCQSVMDIVIKVFRKKPEVSKQSVIFLSVRFMLLIVT